MRNGEKCKKIKSKNPSLSVQWHLTSECGNKCRHCYMGEIDDNDKNNNLDVETLKDLFHNIEKFSKNRNVDINYIFTGGDPLLYKGFFELLNELNKYNKKYIILGNPDTIDRNNVSRLCRLGLTEFQMSLDGLEETHDWVRGNGKFKKAIEGVKILHEFNIRVRIMFTLYRYNLNDLIPLMEVLAKNNVDEFSFDIGIPIGNANNLGNEVPHKEELISIFERYINEKHRLNKMGYKTVFGEKSSLMLLYRLQNNRYGTIENNSCECVGGCHIGWTSTCILEDGSVVACRRLPISFGKLTEQSFEDIWLGSEQVRKFRRKENWTKCSKCELYSWCRGCPAFTYAITGDRFEKNPLCWKEINELDVKTYNNSLDINCSNDVEFNNLKRHINYNNLKEDILNKYEFKIWYSKFLIDKNKRDEFLVNPNQLIQKNIISKDVAEVLHWILTLKSRSKEQF